MGSSPHGIVFYGIRLTDGEDDGWDGDNPVARFRRNDTEDRQSDLEKEYQVDLHFGGNESFSSYYLAINESIVDVEWNEISELHPGLMLVIPEDEWDGRLWGFMTDAFGVDSKPHFGWHLATRYW